MENLQMYLHQTKIMQIIVLSMHFHVTLRCTAKIWRMISPCFKIRYAEDKKLIPHKIYFFNLCYNLWSAICRKTRYPACNYMFKVNNRNNWTSCEICSKLTKRHQNDSNGVVLVSLWLTLNIFLTLF